MVGERENSWDSVSRGSAVGGAIEATEEEAEVRACLWCCWFCCNDVDRGFSGDKIGPKDGVGRPEAFASSMAASCASMRW